MRRPHPFVISILIALPIPPAQAKQGEDVAPILAACLDKGEVATCAKACKLGSGRGCFESGALEYEDAKGSKKKAAALFDKGCTLGETLACTNMGMMLVKGTGIPKDVTRGNKLLAQSCDADDGFACTELGNSYVSGRGYPANVDKAIELHKKACRLGAKSACANLDAKGIAH